LLRSTITRRMAPGLSNESNPLAKTVARQVG
jgi:hypothetical protein